MASREMFREKEEVVPALTTDVQTGGEEVIHRAAKCWDKLSLETGNVPFYRPEWIAAYLRAFEPRNEVVLLTARAGERLVGVLPMVRKRCWFAGVPVVKLAGAANIHSVRFDILRSPCPAGQAAVSTFWTLLQDLPDWQLLALPTFPDNGACRELMACARNSGYRTVTLLFQDGPVLRMQTARDGRLTWLHHTDAEFRHALRRRARFLEKTTGKKPQMNRWTTPDPDALKRFFALEASGWKGRKGSAISCARDTRTFYNQIAREAGQRGYFRLHLLEVGGTAVAGAFGVANQESYSMMKMAYDEGYYRAGPGHLLTNGVMEDCAANRVPEFCFGGNKHRSKTDWTRETFPHWNGFVFRPGVVAQLAYHMRTTILPPLGKLRRQIQRQIRRMQGKETP